MAYNIMPYAIEYIRKLMRQRGITEAYLAESTGISRCRLYRILSDKAPLHLGDAVAIATAVGCTLDEMVAMEGPI